MLSDAAETLHALVQTVEDVGTRAAGIAGGAEDVRDLAVAYGGGIHATTAVAEQTRAIADRVLAVHAGVDDMLGLVLAWQHGDDAAPGAGSGMAGGITGGGSVRAHLGVLVDELTALRSTLDDAARVTGQAVSQARELADFAVYYAGDGGADAARGQRLTDTLDQVLAELTALGGEVDEAITLTEHARGGSGAPSTCGGTGSTTMPAPAGVQPPASSLPQASSRERRAAPW